MGAAGARGAGLGAALGLVLLGALAAFLALTRGHGMSRGSRTWANGTVEQFPVAYWHAPWYAPALYGGLVLVGAGLALGVVLLARRRRRR